MTCKEIHEQITAYVDDRVDEHEYRQKVQQHITYCPDCRAAYELELKTRMVVRQRARRIEMPGTLRETVSGQVDNASQERKEQIAHSGARQVQGSGFDRFGDYFLSPVGVGAAIILVVLGGYALFAPEGQGVLPPPGNGEVIAQPPPSNPENFFNKAANNFSAIVEGNLTVQHATSSQQDLTDYFREKGVGYQVAFPQVRAELAGGVVSEHGSTRFAHLVYTVGDTIIYLFEVPKNQLKDGKVVYVTPDVMAQLEQGKVFWEEPYGTMRLVMFMKGDLICAVVSNAPRRSMEQLLAVG